MGLALERQEVQTESNNPVIEEVKYLLKESAIRFLSEVKVSSIEMFGDAAFLSPVWLCKRSFVVCWPTDFLTGARIRSQRM